jgi:hypothetical protein
MDKEHNFSNVLSIESVFLKKIIWKYKRKITSNY